MKIKGIETRSIWPTTDGFVEVIDQTKLPHGVRHRAPHSMAAAARAISNMTVRGAPLIGATGAYGLALSAARRSLRRGARQGARDAACHASDRGQSALVARPRARCRAQPPAQRARRRGLEGSGRDLRRGCRDLPAHRRARARAFQEIAAKKYRQPLNILTHCNAGWLACVDWGTALAPIYMAHDARHPASCLGGRDAPAQSGRVADRVRARLARRESCGHRRQCRRSSDAAGQGRCLPSSARIA